MTLCLLVSQLQINLITSSHRKNTCLTELPPPPLRALPIPLAALNFASQASLVGGKIRNFSRD
jgi:hypothetical protein